jgi:hypothetical protein
MAESSAWNRGSSIELATDNVSEAASRITRPLIDEMRGIGIEVQSVWDLVNSLSPYPRAIPILIKHLKKPYHPKIKEGIVRALTVK